MKLNLEICKDQCDAMAKGWPWQSGLWVGTMKFLRDGLLCDCKQDGKAQVHVALGMVELASNSVNTPNKNT